MSTKLNIKPKIKPTLDPGYVPAILWTRAYKELCNVDAESADISIALSREDGTVFIHKTAVLSHVGDNIALNNKYIERLVKFLLWQKGGSKITIGGNDAIAEYLATAYSPTGERAFDYKFMGEKMFLTPMTVEKCTLADMPEPHEENVSLGRNLDGCRIGFDLGGSDRKAAAVIDGEVIFSEEIEWNPYFETDPEYHYKGIQDTLKRAAAKLPRVDAIGGSAAGCYVNNEVRVASLFRGVAEDDFAKHVRGIFHKLKEEWGNIPFEVANDGEVTALAGSMSLKENKVLGISMGTSVAAGYCNESGHITTWLNELAFVPINYRDDAPADEWSGDVGCSVQYFCQQGIARLAPGAGIELPADLSFPEQLVEIQKLMFNNDERARKIYETVGICFGYTIAYFAEFYEIENLLLLGRVTSGEGGQIIIDKTEEVLKAEFPELAKQISISTPDEQLKRHGQAIAAASLPALVVNN